MKKIKALIPVAIALLLPLSVEAQDMTDYLDSAVVALSPMLDEYVKQIERESIEAKIGEVDFLIGSCDRQDLRDFVARKLYKAYFTSKIMGDEAVAIHITDEWFSNGRASMGNDFDLMNARIYANINRQSLIGQTAPQLGLEAPDGSFVSLFEENGSAEKLARPAVLYFYDTECSRCRIESALLRELLCEDAWDIDFYAIYAGENREAWQAYMEKNLRVPELHKIAVYHLWDPGDASDMKTKYGLLQTPMLFLIGEDCRIEGRKLDTPALRTMLEKTSTEYEYGNDASRMFFDKVFEGYGDDSSEEEILAVAEYIRSQTMDKGDSTSFKQMCGDMLFWTAAMRGQGWKKGTKRLIEEYVEGMPQLWTEAADSIQVLGYASFLKDLYSRSPEGARLPRIKVQGKKLNRLRNHVVLIVTQGCGICSSELDALESYTQESGKKSLVIDIDLLLRDDPETAKMLLDKFDLTSLPYICTTDKRARVSGKYLSIKK